MKHSVSFAVKQGPRSYQEDRYFYKRIEEQELSGWILAVMDGHGGKTVAELCAQEIEKHFRITISDDPEEVLRLLVAELNSQTIHFHEGSTLSIALILESSSQVSIAVLGDSPVVVFDKRASLMSALNTTFVQTYRNANLQSSVEEYVWEDIYMTSVVVIMDSK